jgi:hypothetical protein
MQVLLLGFLAASAAGAQDSTSVLSDRTVEVRITTPQAIINGTGGWFEAGRVLTASHFFLSVRPEDIQEIVVIWKGNEFKARIEKVEDPEIVDAAMLIVEDSGAWKGARAQLCRSPLKPAQPVATAFSPAMGAVMVIGTYGSPDAVDPLNPELGSTALTAFLPQGASGANVYDRTSLCLVGLLSKQSKKSANGVEVYVTDITSAAELQAFVKQ